MAAFKSFKNALDNSFGVRAYCKISSFSLYHGTKRGLNLPPDVVQRDHSINLSILSGEAFALERIEMFPNFSPDSFNV